MKYTPEQLARMARVALRAKDNPSDHRWTLLVLNLSLRLNMSVADVADEIHRLARKA